MADDSTVSWDSVIDECVSIPVVITSAHPASSMDLVAWFISCSKSVGVSFPPPRHRPPAQDDRIGAYRFPDDNVWRSLGIRQNESQCQGITSSETCEHEVRVTPYVILTRLFANYSRTSHFSLLIGRRRPPSTPHLPPRHSPLSCNTIPTPPQRGAQAAPWIAAQVLRIWNAVRMKAKAGDGPCQSAGTE